MPELNLSTKVDCLNLDKDDINLKIDKLISNSFKSVILTNVSGKKSVLVGLKGSIKIEIVGDVGSDFASDINGLKIVVNGNIGDKSAQNVEDVKFTVFGSCLNSFGNNIKSSEFYILENCTKDSFLNIRSYSKVIIGGQPSSGFAHNLNGGIIVILNLKGGSIFVDDDWFRNFIRGNIYIRGEKNKIKITSNRFTVHETDDTDLDFYLPVISEFARLFSMSLSEIRSLPFYGLKVSNKV